MAPGPGAGLSHTESSVLALNLAPGQSQGVTVPLLSLLHLLLPGPCSARAQGGLRTKIPLAQEGAPLAPPGPPAECEPHLQLLQLLDQGPGADEALVEQGEDGRTFQDGFPESSPRTWHRRGTGGFAVVPRGTVTMLGATC